MRKYWLPGLGLGALLFVGWLVQGCATSCTLMGCSHTVEMTFEPPLEQEGTYEFSFLHEGDTVTCTIALPLPEDPILPCSSAGGKEPIPFATAIHLQESESLGGIIVPLAPRSFQFAIRRDGVEISRTTHKPSYETWYPNGEACDGKSGGCRVGTALVKL